MNNQQFKKYHVYPPEAREKLKQSFIQGGPSGVAELEEFKTLAELPGWGWSKLLRSWDGIPLEAYASVCDWSKLDDDDWEQLLAVHPQFAEKRPVS